MEEPFDELGGTPIASPASATPATGRSGAAPPAAAFQRPSVDNVGSDPVAPAPTSRSVSGPPSKAFGIDSLPSRWAQYENNDGGSSARTPRSSVSTSSANRNGFRDESDELDRLAASSGRSFNSSYSEYKTNRLSRASPSAARVGNNTSPSNTADAGYSFQRSESYDTSELIRKYGGYRPENKLLSRSGAATPPPSISGGSALPDRNIRDQAMKVLNLVDEQLKTPMEVRRTESGGFRASPPTVGNSVYTMRRSASGRDTQEQSGPSSAYAVARSQSGGVRTGDSAAESGRRVPSALAGLNLTRNSSRGHRGGSGITGRPGRYSFSDPEFREDEDLSEEEDDIMHGTSFQDVAQRGHRHDDAQNEAPLVDVLNLEQRSAGSRAVNDIERTFSGDYDYSNRSAENTPSRPTSNWSSRYFSAGGADYTKSQQERFLDRLDREHTANNGAFSGMSASQLFASSASSVRSAVEHVSKKASEAKIFGSGGTGARSSGIFGQSHTPDNNVNLRTVWKDTADDNSNVFPDKPPVHKTWQEAMLNKRRRRRIFLALFAVIASIAIAIPFLMDSTRKNGTVSSARNSGEGVFIPPQPLSDEKKIDMTTVYVTSNVPYDHAEEEKFVKDLENLPSDADFVVHLGNIQEAAVSMCSKSRYTDVASLMLKSPVTTFVVPGAEDWLNCPKQWEALNRWTETFDSFEDNFNHGFDVRGLENYSGVFNILHDGVLFFGLHLVNGPSDNAEVWEQRHVKQREFYFGMVKRYEGKFRAIVFMGNGRPSPQQMSFWKAVLSSVEPLGVPMLYLHASAGLSQGVAQYIPFEEYPDILAVEVPDGGKNPPLKIGVAYGAKPFHIGA